MTEMAIDPVILFFLLGLAGGLLRSDLKLPSALYETLSIYLLLAIGLKGGVELANHSLLALLPKMLTVLAVAAIIPLLAFPVLRSLGKMSRADAASIAAHYGSVSVVTFAVGTAYLMRMNQPFEGYMTVFLAMLEIPALVIGVLLARRGQGTVAWGKLLHEVFLGKSVFLLIGGLLIGWIVGSEDIKPISGVFFVLFKGVLALFLLEMGLIAARQIGDLRSCGLFLITFGVITPLLSGTLGIATGWFLGLSAGGTMLLATLYASASYIAAPAVMRIAVPEANPALSIGASLGITFPFNLMVGIPVYYWMATNYHLIGV